MIIKIEKGEKVGIETTGNEKQKMMIEQNPDGTIEYICFDKNDEWEYCGGCVSKNNPKHSEYREGDKR